MSQSSFCCRLGGTLLLGALLFQLPGIRNHHDCKQRHVGAGGLRNLSSPGSAAHTDRGGQEVVTVGQDRQPSAAQAGGDPFDDDDGKLNRGRPKTPVITTSRGVSSSSKNLPVAEFLTVLRDHLLAHRQHQLDPNPLLSHFGSGPCHSLPRPRDQTAVRSADQQRPGGRIERASYEWPQDLNS